MCFTGNTFAQDIEGKNYEIVFIKDTCLNQIFFNWGYNYPNPFAPSMNDYNIGFRIADTSNVRINITFGEMGYTILEVDTVLTKGCYSLEWANQNYGILNRKYFEIEIFYELEILNKSTNDIFKFNYAKQLFCCP